MNISVAKIRRLQHLAEAGSKPFEHQNQPLYVYITIQDGRRCVRRDPHGKELYQE